MKGRIYLDWIEEMGAILEKKPVWIELKEATKAGENYASALYRVIIGCRQSEGNEEADDVTTTVILKTPLQHKDPQVRSALHRYFQSEIMMYTRVLKIYEELMREDDTLYKLWPRCFCVSTSSSIVLEDLQGSNYMLPCVKSPLPENHAILLLEALGRFHGLSVVAMKRGRLDDPTDDPRFSFFFTEEGLGDNFVMTAMQSVANAIRDTWDSQWVSVSEKLLKMRLTIMDKLRRMEKQSHRVKVLNHGDIWSRNVMFIYQGEEPTRVKFLDYQNPHFNSFAFDVCHLLHGCFSLDLRLRLRSQMMPRYLDSFKRTIISLGLDASFAPTHEELDQELIRLELFGLIVTCSVLPLDCYHGDMNISMEDSMDIDPSRDTKDSRNQIYANPKISKILKDNLTYFQSINLLK